jgi:two-component system, NtrC family, nitrogen regulation sensor histidine kinase NtrY
MKRGTQPAWIGYQDRLVAWALLGGLPGVVVSVALVWLTVQSSLARWTSAMAIVTFWIACGVALRKRLAHPMQTISNLLAAIREGDYSVRGRSPRPADALGEVMREVNTLGSTLRQQRLGAQEALTLLRAVLRDIDVAVFAFDHEQRLRLSNRAGEELLAATGAALLNRTAAELGLQFCLDGPSRFTHDGAFPGGPGRWEIRRSPIREEGLPLDLVVIADLTRVLAEQELQAWQRLVRVLGHELNNSLTPIKSVAGSLEAMLARPSLPDDWREDMARGLSVINARSGSLERFVGAYARLAKLPRPQPQPLNLAATVDRVARLETRLPIAVAGEPGVDTTLLGDPDQIEQVLINLLRNAADAALTRQGGVRVSWARDGAMVEIRIEDDGPGLAGTSNLFVPFFTTKPGGSGIGLVLSRQIAEAHDGALSLEDRRDASGCIARLRLPCVANS